MINWGNVDKVKTEEDYQHERDVKAAKEYLASTDWYVMRLVETSKPVPEDILEKREEARSFID